MKSLLLALMILLTSLYTLYASDENALMEELIQKDSTAFFELASYAPEVRQNVYYVTTQPQGLSRVNSLQNNTANQFRELIASFTKEEQLKIWNLVRYDGLIVQLSGSQTKESVESVLRNYPNEIRDDALELALSHHELLMRINELRTQFDLAFADIIEGYSPAIQQAFRNLLKNPEALSLLTDNMRMTVGLGDLYSRYPELVIQKMNSISEELKAQSTQELNDLEQSIKNDSGANNELQESVQEYAKENNYSDDFYNTDPEVVTRYVYIPYPYWTSYPWWYTSGYWYPYPLWYHCGFYWWHGNIFWCGLPSWHFMHWHFDRHSHFYYYPHLTNIYIHHYYFQPYHRITRTAIPVRTWVSGHRQAFTPDFMTNPERRAAQIKQYGKFELDYQNQTSKRNITRRKFYRQHAAEYPDLQKQVRRIPPVNNQRAPLRNPAVPVRKEQPRPSVPWRQPERRGNNNQPAPVLQPKLRQPQQKPVRVTPRPLNPPVKQRNAPVRKK